jgi:hypothetical protein
MAPRTLPGFAKAAFHALTLALRVGIRVVFGAVGVLASNAKSESASDGLKGSIRAGVLNYRTGTLDDGTDPVGWYEPD